LTTRRDTLLDKILTKFRTKIAAHTLVMVGAAS